MATTIDPLDVSALERAVNDSATRVSGLWLSFVAFSAYLAAAASMITHRQIFLEEPIKLPTINIDLPLVASAILLPLLFVIYHIFVLLQVVLLARTADAYNAAVEHTVAETTDRILVRQRLANTLFAQLFAGSPREREGLLGWLLRLMAWVTLALAPPLVLLVFEIKFLPFHSAPVTWTHRALMLLDLLAVLFLWAGAIKPSSDITLHSLRPHWKSASGAALIMLGCCVFITFPGEAGRTWMRYLPAERFKHEFADCRLPSMIAAVLPLGFDRLALLGEDFVDDDKLAKIVAVANANRQAPSESERTLSFHDRDLRCARLAGADLRRVDFARSDLSGADLTGARLDGATFNRTPLVSAVFDGAQLQDSSFVTNPPADKKFPPTLLTGASLVKAQLQRANLEGVNLERADLYGAQLQEANLKEAKLSGAYLINATLDGADLTRTTLREAQLRGAAFRPAASEDADLLGADLEGASLRGAMLDGVNLDGANLKDAKLQGASLKRAKLRGASFLTAHLQGANLTEAELQGASFRGASLVGSNLHDANLRGSSFDYASLQGSDLGGAHLDAASFLRAKLQGADLSYALLPGASLVETRLQGAAFTAGLADAIIARALLWRTSLENSDGCRDAHVTNPNFRVIWDLMAYSRSQLPIELGPEAIDELIKEHLADAPPEAVERLRKRLAERLQTGPEDDVVRASRKVWTDCAEATAAWSDEDYKGALDAYDARLAAQLIDIGCSDGSYRYQQGITDPKYVAKGIYLYRATDASEAVRVSLARGLLGLDGKDCLGAKGLDEETKSGLRKAAGN